MLTGKDISKSIDGRYILKDVSFSLEAGEILSIIGPSGAGKTSFLRAVSLMDIPDTGSLAIDARAYSFPVEDLNGIDYPYPSLTVVFQQFFIWPHLTVRENMTLALRGAVDNRHFDEVVALFQMADFLERYPNEISIGQRQRTALARALLLKPKYLLLDEVTSALDVEQAHFIQEIPRGLCPGVNHTCGSRC